MCTMFCTNVTWNVPELSLFRNVRTTALGSSSVVGVPSWVADTFTAGKVQGQLNSLVGDLGDFA